MWIRWIPFRIRNTGLYNAKSEFLAFNASLRWLHNFSGVYFVQVSLLLIPASTEKFFSNFGLIFQQISPLDPWI
jgi:hypothetical protein